MTKNTEDWDDLWLKYHGINQKKVEGYFRIFDFYKIDRGTKILDVGCGSGEALKMLMASLISGGSSRRQSFSSRTIPTT
jgi:cyclopropane fatty-acyl-phospholipid synthase-like methyltransferase